LAAFIGFSLSGKLPVKVGWWSATNINYGTSGTLAPDWGSLVSKVVGEPLAPPSHNTNKGGGKGVVSWV